MTRPVPTILRRRANFEPTPTGGGAKGRVLVLVLLPLLLLAAGLAPGPQLEEREAAGRAASVAKLSGYYERPTVESEATYDGDDDAWRVTLLETVSGDEVAEYTVDDDSGEVGGVEVKVAQGDFSYASGLLAGEQLLGGDERPTAIFASNDDMAAAIVSVAHRRHLDVPSELTVAGFDDTSAAVTLWPPLTTVHQPLRRLAAEALAAVTAAASAGSTVAMRQATILDHSIVKRESVARPLGVWSPDRDPGA